MNHAPVSVPFPLPDLPLRSGNDGYTVAELVIALGLTSLIVLLAGQLLVEGVRIADRTQRQLEPLRLASVSTALRADVHRSAAVMIGLDEGWQLGPLELAAWDGSRVRYLLEGERLIREASDGLGRPAGRRTVAAGLTSWWWRRTGPGTVEVRLSAAPPGAESTRRSILRRKFAVRGWPDGRSW